jgi:hypothetical protein
VRIESNNHYTVGKERDNLTELSAPLVPPNSGSLNYRELGG